MSTNALVQRLRQLGISNGRALADHVQAPAVIYFLMTERGSRTDSPRAELHYTDAEGVSHVEVFHPSQLNGGPLPALRKNCIAQAVERASTHLGLPDWRRTAFQHCMLPSACIDRIQAELAALEDTSV